MDFEAPPGGGKTKLVGALVVAGIVILGAAAFVAFKRRGATQQAAASGGGEEVERWCDLRREWAKKADPMQGDILLKMAQDEQSAKQLYVERNKLSQQYAKRLRELGIANEGIKAVEVALIKEGKVRANVAVEIENQLAGLESGEIDTLRGAQQELASRLKRRISEGRAAADAEVSAALKPLGCRGIYRGPMTDEATSENPYTSWDELEFRRSAALKKLDPKIANLEPQEQFRNRVYHTLMAKYRPQLKKCYLKYKRAKPELSDTMGLRVRLKRGGRVASLAIEWMEKRDDRILDCLLAQAGNWRFPSPRRSGDYAVVKLDFSRI